MGKNRRRWKGDCQQLLCGRRFSYLDAYHRCTTASPADEDLSTPDNLRRPLCMASESCSSSRDCGNGPQKLNHEISVLHQGKEGRNYYGYKRWFGAVGTRVGGWTIGLMGTLCCIRNWVGRYWP